MADAQKSGGFPGSFVAGLVIGLVVGGVLGAVLPAFFEGGPRIAPGAGGATPRATTPGERDRYPDSEPEVDPGEAGEDPTEPG